jgi:glycosyltransferase involved in cell wall biosynthesis
MNSLVSFDVICTVRNEISNIKFLIKDLENQEIRPCKVIIVDGGSTDGTYEYLVNECVDKNILVVQDNSNNRGSPIARGRNIAVSYSSSEYILMADAGCRYHSGWSKAYLSSLCPNYSIYSGGSKLGCKVTKVDIASAPFLGFDMPGNGFSAKSTGTCRSLCVTRELFNTINGFSEIDRTGEDTDFINRACKISDIKGVCEGAAVYTPMYTFKEAMRRVVEYAKGDGSYSQSTRRFVVMFVRIILQITSIWSLFSGLYWIFFAVMFLELLMAYRLDFYVLISKFRYAMVHRFVFSIFIPYLYFLGYLSGKLNKI